jgi:Sec-independent protein translocase protein TatA
VIAVVAVLVFGARLPQVAGEAAATLQKVKRALGDLRRETGIDQEIYRAKREFEQGVRKPLRDVDLPNTIRREVEGARRELPPPPGIATGDAPPPPPAWEPKLHEPPPELGPPPRATPPTSPAEPSSPDRG